MTKVTQSLTMATHGHIYTKIACAGCEQWLGMLTIMHYTAHWLRSSVYSSNKVALSFISHPVCLQSFYFSAAEPWRQGLAGTTAASHAYGHSLWDQSHC